MRGMFFCSSGNGSEEGLGVTQRSDETGLERNHYFKVRPSITPQIFSIMLYISCHRYYYVGDLVDASKLKRNRIRNKE